MQPVIEFSHDELVEYARFLYGTKWRDRLPEALDIPRRELVLMLASGEKIPHWIERRTIELVDEDLANRDRKLSMLRNKASSIRARISPAKLRKTQLQAS